MGVGGVSRCEGLAIVVLVSLAITMCVLMFAQYSADSAQAFVSDHNGSLYLAPGARRVIFNLTADVDVSSVPEGYVYLGPGVKIQIAPGVYLDIFPKDSGSAAIGGLLINDTYKFFFAERTLTVGSIEPTAADVRRGGFLIKGDPAAGVRGGFAVRSEIAFGGGTLSHVQSLDDLTVTGTQIHNTGADAITFTSDNKVYVGDVDPVVVANNRDAKVYVGGDVVVESTSVQYNFQCLPMEPTGCVGGASARPQLLRALVAVTTLSNGRAGDYSNLGAFTLDRCYAGALFAETLGKLATTEAEEFAAQHFVFKSAGACVAGETTAVAAMYAAGDTACTGTSLGTTHFTLGELTAGYVLRCWCAAPSEQCTDKMYDIVIGDDGAVTTTTATTTTATTTTP